MKTLLLTYKFLFITLISLPLALCSNDDDNEAKTVSEPIEITFSENLFSDCNQTVLIDNIGLTYRPISINEPSANTVGDCDFADYTLSIEQRENHPLKGLYAMFLGSHLEIDLTKISGYSKIKLTIEDNCRAGCTGANLYVNNEIVETQLNTKSNPIQEELVFDIKNKNAQKVTVYSYEGAIYKINIE
jgi:hypothetical protein